MSSEFKRADSKDLSSKQKTFSMMLKSTIDHAAKDSSGPRAARTTAIKLKT